MIRKTQSEFRRRARTWPKRRYATITEYHNERVTQRDLVVPLHPAVLTGADHPHKHMNTSTNSPTRSAWSAANCAT